MADNGDTPMTLSSFSSIQAGQSVSLIGASQTQNITQISGGTVSGQSMNTPDVNGVNGVLRYGTAVPVVPTAIQFTTPRSSVAWTDGQNAQTVACGSQSCAMSSGAAIGVLVNPTGPGWNFQTFAYWLAITGFPANIVGNISAGRPTPAGSIPGTGASLGYNGFSGGIYVDPNGILQEHAATMAAIVDPVNGTVSFTTSGTTIRAWNSAGIPITAALDITGVLTFAPGSNRFTGTVTIGNTTATLLTGTADGEFFGPNAEEIGGTITLTSNSGGGSVESMTGAFGGKR
ncbi:MAG TPA: transferrin-binding protein-like solute binding protein [Burkholderiales bacterium]|nr:transferrin-binding protein-like solute binding protein [Burkholderiales bacterium]